MALDTDEFYLYLNQDETLHLSSLNNYEPDLVKYNLYSAISNHLRVTITIAHCL